MTEDIKIRACGKSELALLYFPTANSSHTAVNHLMAWAIARPPSISPPERCSSSWTSSAIHNRRRMKTTREEMNKMRNLLKRYAIASIVRHRTNGLRKCRIFAM